MHSLYVSAKQEAATKLTEPLHILQAGQLNDTLKWHLVGLSDSLKLCYLPAVWIQDQFY